MSKRKAYRPRKPVKAKASSRSVESLWDLDRDGLTYSLLSKFVVCPERFRLAAVEGYSESGLRKALEFGNAFHHALEKSPQPYAKSVMDYQRKLLEGTSIHPTQREELEILMAQVEGVLHGYERIWATDHASMQFIHREQVFDVPYQLDMQPGVRTIRLRGKWDGVYREAKDFNRPWLFETKTKSDIDSDGLQRTLPQDLQTMLYVTTLETVLREPIAGVLYNVIRRPSIYVRKGESIQQYANRLKEDVILRPNFYYHRFVVTLEQGDVVDWRKRCFDPLLRHVVRWWDSVKKNPFDPWASPYHYRRPFGIYDGLADGRRGDYFDYFTTGSMSGLRRTHTVFPELEGE